MPSLFRWLRRRRELLQITSRRQEIEDTLSKHLGEKVTLTPADAKGGYDEIFYASKGQRRFAVARINSPFKEQHDPIGPLDPSIPLDAPQRLEREWMAYQRLFPRGLSPEPIWRTHDAIVCSWLERERASVLLARQSDRFWPVMERAMSAIQQMHSLGVTHLDLNWGNLLCQPDGSGLVFIDFEFGPVPWVNPAQQQAFDYLRLMDDSLKPRRGAKVLLADVEKLIHILAPCVPASVGAAPMGFVFDKLTRLAAHPLVCHRLETVFPQLRVPSALLPDTAKTP